MKRVVLSLFALTMTVGLIGCAKEETKPAADPAATPAADPAATPAADPAAEPAAEPAAN